MMKEAPDADALSPAGIQPWGNAARTISAMSIRAEARRLSADPDV
jgi:hypothetical protein